MYKRLALLLLYFLLDLVVMINDKFINPVRNEISNGIKLTNAVYKILDFFPESEPLKNKAKEKTLAIMENLTLVFNKDDWVPLKACLPENKEKASEQILRDIEVLLSFLKLAKFQGWLSDANFLIVSNEYEKVKKEVLQNFPEQKLFQTEALKTTEEINIKITEPVVLNLPLVKTDKEKKSEEKQDILKDSLSERQKKILKFLKENKKAQVMDLQAVLADVTKRTIRRDLDDLLKKGSIIRVGEWNQVFYQISENSR